MKKLNLVITLIFASAICHAQTTAFGLKAGVNFSEQIHNDGTPTGFITGFNAGAIMDLGYKNFSIQPGLFFTSWGERTPPNIVPLDGNPETSIASIRTYYIELPVNFLYRSKSANGNDIHLGGGPYIAYGISQHDEFGSTAETIHPFGYSNPDLGLDAVLGGTFSHILVDAGFSYGLINTASAPSSNHNLNISLSGGYLFK